MKTPHPRKNPNLQRRQRELLKAQQARGVPLVQRRSDGVYVARHADGREVERPYRDRPDNAPFK